MKRIHKILGLILFAFIFFIIGGNSKVHAADASITASKTVTQGSTVTVTGSVTAGGWNMTLSGAGQSKGLVGNTSTTSNQSASTSITFTANNLGTYDFVFKGDITDYVTDATTYPEKKCTITVVAASNNGGDNNGGNNGGNGGTTVTAPTLSNLGIKPHDFSGFSPNKTSYTVNVPNDCTTVNLYATSKNGSISGTGNKTLKEGTNKFAVTVSNDAGSKTYYVSVVRMTSDGNEPPNVIDEQNPDETDDSEEQDGIGLSALEIPGYELDKEFKSDVYSYTIKVKKQLTETELEALKEKIVATANAENVQVEVTTNLSDDGVSTITIVVKDDEKEYAKYVVTFEVEKEDTKVAGVIKSNSGNGLRGMFGLTEEQQIYAILGGIGAITLFAMAMSFVAYAKSRRLAEYEDDYEEEERDEDSDFYKMNQYYMETQASDWNKKNEPEAGIEVDRSAEITDKTPVGETVRDAAEGIRRTNGYRRIARGRRSYGKH